LAFAVASFAAAGWAQVAEPPVPVGDPEGRPALARQLARHGITWHFDREHVVGTFANGDPWVLGPVAIVRIEPRSVLRGERVVNGSMIDPRADRLEQGYDGALFGAGAEAHYVPEYNAAWGIGRDTPLRLPAGASLVSVVSRDAAVAPPTLRAAAVLTCVTAPPPPDAFRPPSVAGDKSMPHRAAELDFDVLRRLPPVAGMPAIEAAARQFERLWLDHFPTSAVRFAHPLDNMPDYGRDIAAEVGSAALLLNSDLPRQQKHDLLVRIVQIGIDAHGALRGGCRWPGDGGHGHGRKLPILVAGALLHDEGLLAVGREFAGRFGEDGQTFFVVETGLGVWNEGHGGYTAEHAGLAEWGVAHGDHPERDEVSWSSNAYRVTATANAWVGEALAARVMGLQDAWHHPPFFAYMDRYMQVAHQEPWHRSWVAWHAAMWDTYRANH
jgi:hypothetical protein